MKDNLLYNQKVIKNIFFVLSKKIFWEYRKRSIRNLNTGRNYLIKVRGDE